MREILLEYTIDDMHMNMFYTKIQPGKDSTYLITFGDYNKQEYFVDTLVNSSINISTISGIYIPKINKTYNGIKVNTIKDPITAEKKVLDAKLPIKIYRTLPSQIPEGKFFIIDLMPVLRKLKPLFDKKNRAAFKYYFEFINSIQSTLKGKKVPVLVLDTENITEDFIMFFDLWLKTNEYTVDLDSDKLVAMLQINNKTYFTILGTKINNKIQINKVVWSRIRNYLMNELKKFNDKITDEAINNLVTKILEKYNFSNDKNYKQIHELVKNYLLTNPEKIDFAKKYPEKLIEEVLRNMANIDINVETVDKQTLEKKLNEIGQLFSKKEKIKPVISEDFTSLIPLDELINVETTIKDRHEYELNELQDYYTREIFKKIEKSTYPLKIKDIRRELRDDNINRVYRYTITVEDDNKNIYDLTINMPALVNNRYFKLNGKNYILVNQLFLKPITKANHNSVRFLSNYATVTLELRNSVLPITDINEILEYIINKYGNHIKLVVLNKDGEQIPEIAPIKYLIVSFDNGYTFYGYNPKGDNKYIIFDKKDENGNILFYTYYDANTKKIYRVENDVEIQLPYKFYEYVLTKLSKIVSDYDSKDLLARNLKSIPYIQIHIAGIKLPYIKFLILFHGLIGALKLLNIDYKISDKEDVNAYYTVKFKDKYVNIYPKNLQQKYIINGLKLTKINFEKYNLEQFESNMNLREEIFLKEYTPSTIKNFKLIRENIVDTITEKLLKYDNKPTNFDEITVTLIDELFNKEPTSPVDLRNARIRLTEILHNILYKQIAMALHDYEVRKSVDKNAKLYINPDYVINQLLQGESTLQYIEPINPIDELNTATRVTPTGIGGVPKNSIQLIHRLIPLQKLGKNKYYSSYFGNISALDTNEYSNVGINQELTYKPLLSDKFGILGFKYDISKETFETLGIGESLAPWIQSIDHDRTVKMAQQMRQTMPLINPDPPLVQSGAESLIPQLSSSRFNIRAEDDGEVIEVKENEYIIVKYKNGKTKAYNILPRVARLKRGKFIPLQIKVNVKPGDKVKKNQILAGTTQTVDGIYKYGKNVVVALMPYNGGGFEDGWVVTEDVLEKFKHIVYEDINVLIPENAIVNYVAEEGQEIKVGDTVVEYTFNSEDDLNAYYDQLTQVDQVNNDFEVTKFKNTISIKSNINGRIKDLYIYINGNVDPKIETLWKKKTKKINEFVKKLSKINGKEDLSSVDNIDLSIFKRGTHKFNSKLFKGARLLYFVEVERVPTYSDKFVFRGGNKGVITYIIPKDKKPIALESKLEIDWIHNPLSVIGRKNANILLELGVGKVLYFLNKKAKEMAEDTKVKTKDIKKLVLDVYNTLDQTEEKKLYNAIKNRLDELPDDKFRKLCKKIDPLNKPLFIYLAVPFSKMKVEWINDALELLGIPLEEKVYIPEFNTQTENPVTVGVAYVTMLEYMPEIMMGFRSVEKYNPITGQGIKGKSMYGIGAARIDELTATGLLSYFGKDSKIIKELYTVQSDDKIAKDDVIFKIIHEGKAPEDYKISETKTKSLLRNLLYGVGVDPKI